MTHVVLDTIIMSLMAEYKGDKLLLNQRYTVWGHKIARNYVLSAHYITLIIYHLSFMPPYGILLADSTIKHT
jgi:hypothetical protein